jgi:Nucleotidyl transferase AbiEii toxin, Type IV TA system
MNTIAQMPARRRAEVFSETADRRALSEAIIEKDFWVCWILKQLFSIEALSGRILFKGGTSLSKIFHAINRFSEDIDLAVDYVGLGFTGERDPRREGISKTKRAGILAEMMVACQRYIGGEFLEILRTRCEQILGTAEPWSLEVSELDPNVIRFRYPASAKALSYVAPQVVLELGTHAELCRMVVSQSGRSLSRNFQS